MRIRFRIWPVLAGVLCLVLLTGCGGIHASKGFSPLSLLLPGVLQHEPEKPLVPEPALIPAKPAISDNEEDITA